MAWRLILWQRMESLLTSYKQGTKAADYSTLVALCGEVVLIVWYLIRNS